MKKVIAHAGAWNSTDDKANRQEIEAVTQSVAAGVQHSGEEIVTTTVSFLEDTPFLDAGTGSILQMDGRCRMDSAIASFDGSYAGILQIEEVKNPIQVVAKLKQYGYHSILCGDGAKQFAREEGFPFQNVITLPRAEKYLALRNEFPKCTYRQLATNKNALDEKKMSTVGAVAIDNGKLFAGVSTGGLNYGYPGRVGDTGILGAGIFCNKHVAAVCTGEGDKILKSLTAKNVWLSYKENGDIQKSVEMAIEKLSSDYHGQGGIIALDAKGQGGVAYNTLFLATAESVQAK
jgi:isoaspartyl peptidase/L-asparaginase-like protein (Ntn-hydrolase superfamily)